MTTTALITGGNKGIGLETARKLAKEGCQVILGCRNFDAGQAVADKLREEGHVADAVQLDVTDATSIKNAAETVQARYGKLDILVNNAGIMLDAFDRAPSEQMMETWKTTFDTNLFGVVAVTQAFLPLIKNSKAGRIVNVSSILGSMAANTDPESTFYGFKIPAYNISKTALNAWTIHLAYELRDTSIKVNSAHPGFVKTDLHGVDAPLRPDEGAETSVRLALLSAEGPNGAFFHGSDVQPW